jgi:flagellar hook-associated protein 1 FlgK
VAAWRSAKSAERWRILAGVARMTTISAALLAGLSGLRAAQAGLSVASQNIANASTPGYVRTEVSLAPRPTVGASGGVDIAGVRRAADRFLAVASHVAGAAHSAASARADLLTRAQASFGDPTSGPSMFTALDDFWSSLTQIGVDPSSSVRRADAVSALQTMFGEVRRVGGVIQDLISEADERIADKVSEAQDLIDQVAALNREIQLNQRSGVDVTSAENAQSAVLDKLAALMDVQVSAVPEGGVHVRTKTGALLVGVEAAKLSYTATNTPFGAHSAILINAHLGANTNIEPMLQGGEIKGLLQARDQDLPALADALAGFAATLADQLNKVHNDGTTTPAPTQLVGRQTGLLATDAVGFTGRATIGVLDASGTLSNRLSVNFDTQTITTEAPVGSYSFSGDTIGDLVNAINAALGASTPAGSANFTDGVLSLNVNGGGVVVQQDAAAPSARLGRGFSHFFGLNDVVSRPSPLFFENGVGNTDLHGLNTGGELVYDVRDSAGRFIATRTISITGPLAGASADWDDLVSALNAPASGLGEYAAFNLNGATGRLEMSSNPGFQVTLRADTTQRGNTGVSVSALHGLTEAAQAGRAIELDVNARIAANPTLLAVGRADLSVALGQRAVEAGDSRGAAALAAARNTVLQFQGAGGLGPQTTTLTNLAARLGGEVGRRAADVSRTAAGAQAVLDAATDRRTQAEGVSLDDELLKMTSYQNAYAASARVIQAASDMLDILMTLGIR